MAQFETKEEILSKIDQLYKEMNSNALDISDLDELVRLSNELLQRNIIIRYKAIENKVFGKSDSLHVEEEKLETSVVEEPIFEEKEPVIASIVEEEVIEKVEEKVSTESTFADTPLFSFDLFASENETVNNEPLSEVKIEEKVVENNAFETEQPIIKSEEIVTEFEDNSIEIERSTIIENPISHEIIKEEHSFTTEVTSGNVAKYLAKFREIDRNISSQFGITKLDSLVGSFGLNERLQFINELFDGSSELFSEAIKTLDHQHISDVAYQKTAEFGIQNNWDLESETVEEFMQKIARRFL